MLTRARSVTLTDDDSERAAPAFESAADLAEALR